VLRVARFLHGFLRPAASAVTEQEVEIPVNGGSAPATLLRPPGERPLPAFLVLHGITVPGRHHPVLVRFARSLAASGAVVMIPEIEPWRRLRIDPDAADAILIAATAALAAREDVRPGGVALVGFSFGATHALVSAAHGRMGEVRSVVGFGGYCDLRRTLRFMMTGDHEWQGKRYRLEPDPYGRWIVAANYLTSAEGYGGMDAVAAAAGELAAEAGRVGAYAGDPRYDASKARLRAALQGQERKLWDLLAPPTGVRPAEAPAYELAEALVVAALAHHPQLDPRAVLPRLRRPLVLAHGFSDHLIPFTETLRLRTHLAHDAPVHTTVTRLFAHSSEARLPPHRYPTELARYALLLARALR
jgi:hypothetical protein